MRKAVVLLSGGLDSTTCLLLAKKQGFKVYALTLRYGQKHGVEIIHAKKIAKKYGVAKHTVLDIDLSAWGGSSLLSDMPVPKGRSIKKMSSEIPSTYVPARNTVFLSLALSYAEAIGASDIFIGANAVDYSGYPDCRPRFIRSFEALANVATKAGVQGRRFGVHAPLLKLTKAEIIRLGKSLGVDFSLTHSCYDPSPKGKPCGKCDSCLLRKKGFEEAGEEDTNRE